MREVRWRSLEFLDGCLKNNVGKHMASLSHRFDVKDIASRRILIQSVVSSMQDDKACICPSPPFIVLELPHHGRRISLKYKLLLPGIYTDTKGSVLPLFL